LHAIWPVLETHARRLERLCQQQAGIRFELVSGESGQALAVSLRLGEPNETLRILLRPDGVRYLIVREGQVMEAHPCEAKVDRAVYLLLAELAAQVG
jgi:hypothetical protein